MTVQKPTSFFDRHYFLLRRLHSLTGIVPIGAFLFPHLTTNSSIVWGSFLNPSHLDPEVLERMGVQANSGVETFQHEVNFIHSLPALVLVEVLLIWLPIAFHAGLGESTSRGPVARISAAIAIRTTGGTHCSDGAGTSAWSSSSCISSSLRWGWTYGGLLPSFDPLAAASSTAFHLQEGPLGPIVPLFYLLGVLALVYHFANGLWTAAITWGLTISEAAQRRWGVACAAIGVALGVMGVMAVFGFWTLNVDQAREIERLMHGGSAPAAVVSAVP